MFAGNSTGVCYVLKIDAAGNQLWGDYIDSPCLQPRELIESPYNSNELIVVGRFDNCPNVYGTDAFFMKLNANTGANISMRTINWRWDSDDWFSCIEPAFSPAGGQGYILGGWSHGHITPNPMPTNSNYTQWMCKLDQHGNIIWTTLVHPAYFPLNNINGSEITGVYERFNSGNSTYEYYGVAGNFAATNQTPPTPDNLCVYKLDDNGTVPPGMSPTEFHYFSALSPVPSAGKSFPAITGIDTGGGSDDGIQVFGTDTSRTGHTHHFVKGYFNGVSGCREVLTDIDSIKPGPDSVAFHQVTIAPLTLCLIVNLISNVVNQSSQILCYANSISGGSNARVINGVDKKTTLDFNSKVWPNPTENHLNLEFPTTLRNRSIRIKIYNNVGVKVYENYVTLETNGKLEISLKDIGLVPGLYNIYAGNGEKSANFRVLYSGY
jgi:hypothetical protein